VRTLHEVLRLSTGYLEQHGSPTPRLDAELLLGHALGLSRVEVYTQHDRPLSEPELAAARGLLARRAAREPVAYILGEWGFRGLTLAVDRRVLVPRPETEELVGVCLELLVGDPAPAVLDVGTGSGAIALAIRQERPDARVAAVYASLDALAVARENGRRLGLEVEWIEGDLLAALPGRRFGLVVSNPPYIAEHELAGLEPEVRDWEPRMATTAGADGHAVLERLVDEAPDALEPGGRLVVEVGAGQAPTVARWLRTRGWTEVDARRDFAGVERIVLGTRP
jgi:release factor glutamine methyltransferase